MIPLPYDRSQALPVGSGRATASMMGTQSRFPPILQQHGNTTNQQSHHDNSRVLLLPAQHQIASPMILFPQSTTPAFIQAPGGGNNSYNHHYQHTTTTNYYDDRRRADELFLSPPNTRITNAIDFSDSPEYRFGSYIPSSLCPPSSQNNIHFHQMNPAPPVLPAAFDINSNNDHVINTMIIARRSPYANTNNTIVLQQPYGDYQHRVSGLVGSPSSYPPHLLNNISNNSSSFVRDAVNITYVDSNIASPSVPRIMFVGRSVYDPNPSPTIRGNDLVRNNPTSSISGPRVFPSSSLEAPASNDGVRVTSPLTQHHPNQQTISLDATNSNISFPLGAIDDDKHLSTFLCYLRSEILEVFVASAQDTVKRKGCHKIYQNQVGIRCRFCARLPHDDRKPRSTTYPSSIEKIYQNVTMMISEHIRVCEMIPEEKKKVIEDLGSQVKRGVVPGDLRMKNATEYWIHSAKRQGMVDCICEDTTPRPIICLLPS